MVKLHTSKAVNHTFWNVAGVVLTPALFFITIPFHIKYLGEEQYGLWVFVNTIIIVLQILNLGLPTSAYKHVAVSIPKRDYAQMQITINTTTSLTLVISLIGFLGIGALSLGIYHYHWFIHDTTYINILYACLFVGGFVLTGKLLENVMLNVFRAFEKFRTVALIMFSFKIVSTIISLIIAYVYHNVFYILIAISALQLLEIFYCFWYFKRLVPGYSYRWMLKKHELKHELKYSLYTWIQSVAVAIVYQSDRFLVSYIFGFTALTYYSIVATLFNHIHMGLAALSGWLFPRMAKLKTMNKDLTATYISIHNISTAASILLLCLFALFYQPLFTLWLGAEKLGYMIPFIKWYTAFQLFFIFTINPYYYLNAIGHERLSTRLVLMFSGLNLAGILFGYFMLGTQESFLIGLTVSTVIAMFLLLYFLNKRVLKQYSISQIALMLLPSFAGMAMIFTDNIVWRMVWFLLCMTLTYIIYLKNVIHNKTISVWKKG